jgi:hypothetical protein
MLIKAPNGECYYSQDLDSQAVDSGKLKHCSICVDSKNEHDGRYPNIDKLLEEA